MKIIFGCDPNAKQLKKDLMTCAEEWGHEVIDYGSDDPIYANTAIKVATDVVAGKAERGVLLCGTGIGMSIAANKVKGAYAALLSDGYSAERAILSNDSNIACIGALTVGSKLAQLLLKTWLSQTFDPESRSRDKVARYKTYDMYRTCSEECV